MLRAVVLVPIFLLLFASWMLWGWIVGESKNIRWMRRMCATSFVCTMILITAGAAAITSRVLTRNAIRDDVSRLLQSIEFSVRSGDTERVLQAIEAADHSEDPDRDAFDLLNDLPAMAEQLTSDRTRTAIAPQSPQVH